MASSRILAAVKKTIFSATTTSPRTLGFGFRSRRTFSCGVPFIDPSVSIVKLQTSFGTSSPRVVGNGVLVLPGVIVTSAHVVGRVAGSDCEVGRTVATAWNGRLLRTRPLAVNFGGDVAVLHAAGDADSIPPPSPLGHDVVSKESPVMVLTRHESCRKRVIVELKVRAVKNTSPRTEWVYPVGDEYGWARYGCGPDETITIYPGSPWVSFQYEIVGIASWAVGNCKEPYGSPGNFVVPPPRIRAALDYAATKRVQDRIVMDQWIEKVATVADGCDDPIIAEECISHVPVDSLVSSYLPI